MRLQYRRKQDHYVVAVQLSLETDGFSYRKWGGEQRCKRGDWLVNNEGDVYTVDGDVFARTYRELRPGHFWKAAPIWAEVALAPGSVRTLEGITHYEQGDYVVADEQSGSAKYAVSAKKFESMYEPAA